MPRLGGVRRLLNTDCSSISTGASNEFIALLSSSSAGIRCSNKEQYGPPPTQQYGPPPTQYDPSTTQQLPQLQYAHLSSQQQPQQIDNYSVVVSSY